jgi:hypothetical protein
MPMLKHRFRNAGVGLDYHLDIQMRF